MDYLKIADRVELMPALDREAVRALLRVAAEHWTGIGGFIVPKGVRPDKLALDTSDEMARFMRAEYGGDPVSALTDLLASPRALKKVISEVNETWSRLAGEAELHDIIIVVGLKFGAPRALSFVVQNLDAARREINRDQRLNQLDSAPTTLKDRWREVLSTLKDPDSVQKLVDLLGLPQLRSEQIEPEDSQQGISKYSPTDYFRRILAGQLAPNELRDQEVLRDISSWRTAREPRVVERLATCSDLDQRYARVWEHFSLRELSREELFEIGDQVVNQLLRERGPDAAADQAGIISVWRRLNGRRDEQGAVWLSRQVGKSTPVSLQFANELLYYWTGQHAVVTDDDAHAIQRDFGIQLQQIAAGGMLVEILTPTAPFQCSVAIKTATSAGIDLTVPIVEALLLAASRRPDVVVGEFANLLGNEVSGRLVARPGPDPLFIHPYGFDREKTMTLLGDRLDAVLTVLAQYDGKNPWAVRPKQAALDWLNERIRGDEQHSRSIDS